MEEPRAGKTEATEQDPEPTPAGPRIRIAEMAARARAGATLARAGAARTLRAARKPVLVIGAVVVVSTVLGVGAYAAAGFYDQFGAPRTPTNVRSWQLRPMAYLASDCRGCHTDQAAQAAIAGHSELLCESCHAPAVDHPGPVPGVVQMLPRSTSADCIVCHAQVAGRPVGTARVDVETHYAGADCISCHEPHSSAAVAPREVTHPLANLPSCITCHSPVGLKRFPAAHVAAPDETCLACHRIGAVSDDWSGDDDGSDDDD